MIEGIEQLYQEIAQAMIATLFEEWSSAKFEAIFYPTSSVFEAEYIRSVDGKARSFAPLDSGIEAIEQVRQLFQDAGRPLWGRASFELLPNGQFSMTFGYDGCDADGNAIFDEDQEVEREGARRRRLTQ